MRIGDIIRNVRWGEVNNCTSFQEGDKRKVKVYWKIVEKLEFKDKISAERWLYNYWKNEKGTKLLSDLNNKK